MGLEPKFSADTYGGWRNHFARMQRWKDRCTETLGSEDDKTNHEGLDFALTYFVWSHSLIEWLSHDEDLDKKDLTARMESKFPDWAIIRDIANRSRHLDLKRDPKDKYWSALRMYYSYEKDAGGMSESRWVLWHEDKIYEMSNLIWLASQAWSAVLNDLGLDCSMEYDEWKQPKQ